MSKQYGCTSTKIVDGFEVYILRYRGDDTVYIKQSKSIPYAYTVNHVLKGKPNLPVDLDMLRSVVEELMKELG